MSLVFSYVKSLDDSPMFKEVKTKSNSDPKKGGGKDVAAFELYLNWKILILKEHTLIQKFISGLTDNQKKLLAIALVIVALLPYLIASLIGPTMSRLSAIDGDIVKEESSIKQDLHFLGYKQRILKESEELQPYFTDKVASDDEMIAAFLKQLENLAATAKINIIKVTPSPGVRIKTYLKYEADLDCNGKLADVITFMHLVNTLQIY